MQSRISVGIGVVALAALALTGCSNAGSGSSSDAAQATGPINIWYSNNEAEVEWGKSVVEAWNAEHPDEQVTAQEVPAGKSTEETITAAITAGTTPCLVFNNLPAATGQWQKQGGLVNLSQFSDGNDYIEARSGSTADSYRSTDGNFYQMPWKSNPVQIFFNKDVFAAAGLDSEDPDLSTYDGFLAAAKAIKDSGAAPYAIYPAPTSEFFQPNWDFLPLYAAATGGEGLTDSDGAATFDNEAGLEVTEFWKTVYENGYAGAEPAQGDPFASGTAAMAIVGPWAIAAYDAVNWGSVPVPTKDGISADDTYTFADAKNIGMYSSCENQSTAWEFLKFATSEEEDGQLLELTGQMPIRADLATTYADYFTANPAYEEFASQAERTVDDPAGENTVSALQGLRDFYTKAVITGDGDLQEQLSAAAEAFTQQMQN